MKEFSKKWSGSKQPRKQRKFQVKAPLSTKRKMLSVNLSKEIRKTAKKRNVPVKKGDKVKIMRGKFKGKTGKVIEVKTKQLKVYVEGIQKTKMDGSKVNVSIRPSNLQIIELNTDDKKRFKTKAETPKKEEKSPKVVNKKTKEKKE